MTGGQPPRGADPRDASDTGYGLNEPAALPPRTDPHLDPAAMASRDPRWCLGCGHALTLIDKPPCPHCERMFNPEDPTTFSGEPIDPKDNYWTQAPRIAGYIVLPLFLIGRLLINDVGERMVDLMSGSGGMAGGLYGAIVTVLVLPWFLATTLLLLIALEDYYNPKLVVCVTLGPLIGVLIALGLSPLLVVCGAVLGLTAGVFQSWRSK